MTDVYLKPVKRVCASNLSDSNLSGKPYVLVGSITSISSIQIIVRILNIHVNNWYYNVGIYFSEIAFIWILHLLYIYNNL